MPAVSVVTPTYQREKFLIQALESVICQSYVDFEVLVVDDGSSESTARAVRNLGDVRIRYIPQSHAGRSVARNRAMEQATGEYIAFLDDDDLYFPDKLTRQVAFMEANPDIDLIGAGVQVVDANGRICRTLRTWEVQPSLTLLNCLYACPLVPSTVLFRRRVLDGLEQWFDEALGLGEDKDFFVRLLLTGCRMAWQKDIVTVYRMHGANSQIDGPRYSQAKLYLLDKIFARTDLPPNLLAERTMLYGHYYLAGACLSYATGHVEAAQQDLIQALRWQPALIEGKLPVFASSIASFADTIHVDNPRAYIDFVFEHLPPLLTDLKRYHRETLSASHMQHVFSMHKTGQPISIRQWLLGMWYAPRWARNRGVWSIIGKGLLSHVNGRIFSKPARSA